MNAPQQTPAERLAQGIATLRLSLSAAQQVKLLGYLDGLAKWNRVYNLTAVRGVGEMVTRHLLDSLAVIPYVKGPSLLDVGTGAGLPGIPLAIALPDLQVTLLDSVAKKSRFLLQVTNELQLSNVLVKTQRVEKYRPEQLFDTVIARAFTTVAEFATVAGPLCRPGGVLLAMKGRYPEKELAALPPDFQVDEVVPLTVPGLNEERHLVRLSRQYSFES